MERLRSIIKLFDGDKAAFSLGIFFFMLALSVNLFTMLVLGSIPEDSDSHGRIGKRFFEEGKVAIYPGCEPTVSRGPVYPVVVAFSLLFGKRLFPLPLAIIQSILFGLICFLVHRITQRLFSSYSVSFFSTIICGFNPFVIKMTRVPFMETAMTLMILLIAMVFIRLEERLKLIDSVLLGLLLGISTLLKAVMMPLIALLPLLLLWYKSKQSLKLSFIIILVSLSVIAPWTYRNYELTGKFIPVHLLMGYNMRRGDLYIQNFDTKNFSNDYLWTLTDELSVKKLSIPEINYLQYRADIQVDSIFMAESIELYKSKPFFILKKVFINQILFWTLGATLKTSLAYTFLWFISFCFVIIGVWHTYKKDAHLNKGLITILAVSLLFTFHRLLFSHLQGFPYHFSRFFPFLQGLVFGF
jgi:hypothetical protein